jgi:hypothetical protein
MEGRGGGRWRRPTEEKDGGGPRRRSPHTVGRFARAAARVTSFREDVHGCAVPPNIEAHGSVLSTRGCREANAKATLRMISNSKV